MLELVARFGGEPRWTYHRLHEVLLDRMPPRWVLAAGLIAVALVLAGTGTAAAQRTPPGGLPFLQAMQQQTSRAIEKAESSVVAIARVRLSDKNDEAAVEQFPGSLRLPGFGSARDEDNPLSPEFAERNLVPNEFGSGVVVSRDGLILTNYHVLGDPQHHRYYVWIRHRPYEAKMLVASKVMAGDPWTDLAVLKVDVANLTPINFGDATGLPKGTFVITLGNPYAVARTGEPSASWGIISSVSRRGPQTPYRHQARDTIHQYGGLIQVDARLNLGSSGGALLDLDGNMIGLTTSIAALAGYEKSAGYAIPVDKTFKRVVETLKQGRQPAFGFLGVSTRNLTTQELDRGLSGTQVIDVVAGTPAAAGDVRQGDLITHVDDRPIHSSADLLYELGKKDVEEEVLLALVRNANTNSRRLKRSVRLSKKRIKSDRPAFSQVSLPKWRGMQVDYASVLLRPAGIHDVPAAVTVLHVDQDSAAWQAGFRPREYISHVRNRRVTTPSEFHQAVAGLGGEVELRVVARGTEQVRIVTE